MTDRDILADHVRVAVEAVHDPELHRPMGELGMIRRVEVRRRGRARIEVALTTPNCPLAERINRDVTAAARTVDGVTDVDVELTTMTPAERDRIAVADPAPPRQVYAVASGKGGVGKSTIAANLAVALAQRGRRVGLIDADVWGYSVPQLFGVHRAPVAMNGRMLPVPAHGVALMSLGFFVPPDEPVIWRGPMLHKALTQFVEDTHWGELDVLILDLPPGTGDVTLSVLELLPDAALVAVTTPQPAALSVAGRIGALARQVGMPIAGVVENMSESICPHCGTGSALFGSGGGDQLATNLGCDVLGRVPLDVDLRQAGDAGIPVMVNAPRSPSATAILEIVDRLRPVRRPLAGRPLSLTPTG
ncbi:Mrp/NBP35 family ATP-binding protein [Mycolicibacterium chlorophenolicum]|uniref:Iron-sulfur cluster carrier protein n=1 Tax=Mycolicibacterium chlorophenolicum TaxID=37916 RepID=A0A0J6WH02_9MYCO|nr:P-loop NTPase [Mycolicibacterium chlorophenolicum]KMO82505.1 Septum site-determining protein MinD [Mycolicibacterium chlorophenolicum]